MTLACRSFSVHHVAIGVAVSLALLFCAADAGAQASRVGATLEGIVRDTSGAVIPNSKITLHNPLTNQSRTVTTNEQGFFRAEQLSVGTYEVRVEQTGFAPYRQTGVGASLGQTIHLDIMLAPASESEKVTVSAQPSAVDTSQTSVLSSVDQERIEELPVRSRNYLDFVLVAPGVSSSPISSGASGSTPLTGSGFTFGGLRSRSNNLSIDGLDNNDEYTGSSRTELSPEIVQEFQVVNNGLSAESGGASGGSINVITRSGTNTIHGDAFLFAQEGAFNARDPFETEPGKPSFRRFRAGFALGGPTAKDKTFYYAALEQEHNRGQIGSDIDSTAASTINAFLATGAFPGLATRQVTPAFSPIARSETEAAGQINNQPRQRKFIMLCNTPTKNNEIRLACNIN